MNDKKEVPGDDEFDFLDELDDLLGNEEDDAGPPEVESVDELDIVDFEDPPPAPTEAASAELEAADAGAAVELTSKLEQPTDPDSVDFAEFVLEEETPANDESELTPLVDEIPVAAADAVELPATEVWEASSDSPPEAKNPEAAELIPEEVHPSPSNVAPTGAEDGAELAAVGDSETEVVSTEPTKPFDMLDSPVAQPMAVAPVVPARRGGLYYLTWLLGVLMGAVALQLILWWGAGMDPLDLAILAPQWAVPSSLRPGEVVAVMPGIAPPVTGDDFDVGSDTTMPLDDDATGGPMDGGGKRI